MPFRRLPALGSLRAFEAAARHGSFKAAATELAVTPGAVSQQIRGLEEDLDVKLFARAVRSVSLTESGQRLQPALTSAFMMIREAVDDVRPQSQSPLRVQSSGPIIGKWLLPRLHRFAERYPELGVSIQSVNPIIPFGDDGPDVSIRYTRKPSSGLFAQKLCAEYLLPLASPDLIGRLGLRDPSDMVRAPLLHDTSNEVFGEAPDWATWFAAAGLDPAGARRGMRFDRHAGDHAIDAAVNGAGVVLGRRFLARQDMLDGRLVSPCGPVLELPVSYFVVCPKGDESRPEIAAFINWMREETAAMADAVTAEVSIA
ncbi:MAG: LysR substrate-binding domain-containing protein [Pseudomonadota bacterium]